MRVGTVTVVPMCIVSRSIDVEYNRKASNLCCVGIPEIRALIYI